MNQDNLPSPDPEFNDWFENFHGFVTANSAKLGVTTDQTQALSAVHDQWGVAHPAHKTATAAALAATHVKNQARAAAEGVVRPLIQQLQASPSVTDEQRKSMRITVHSASRTPSTAPTTAPVAIVDTSQRLRHLISYRDATGKRAKPKGVAFCEIWSKVGGPPPTDISQMTYLGNASRTPQIEEYPASQAGQLATYWLRWVSTRGEKGPWSQPASATIAG